MTPARSQARTAPAMFAAKGPVPAIQCWVRERRQREEREKRERERNKTQPAVKHNKLKLQVESNITIELAIKANETFSSEINYEE
jgi:hypothetical protein